MTIRHSDDDPQLAVRAAQSGAAVVRDMYGSSLARYAKGAGDFATAADVAAEQAILDVLRAARPEDAVTGEESGATGEADAGRRWLVDPLCGTLNYAVRTPLVAVNVALRVGAGVTAAASADPFSGEVFWTDGARAFVRRDGSEGRRSKGGSEATDEELTPSADSRLVDVNLDPPFPNAPGFRTAQLLNSPAFIADYRPRVVSSTIAVAWVAAGRRAAYVTDGHQGDSVHFAAGIALCKAAGCVVTGIHGQPVDSGAGGLVVAADAPTHSALLAMIRAQLPDRP
ncbi:inositol monophosphatase family protein (plasmid) [Streptomyces sp. CA-294286]|uniref:inositol monophosphatase family protein n=1 Tax=Streptomyces sp. CA-294286 TaxID=3240070 RepID=UPI003D93E700